MTANAFISKYAIWAVLNGAINNVPPSIALAQAALESGWGNYVAGNNLFGIKADPSWTGAKVYSRTTEEYNGNTISQTSAFRAYDTALDSFRDHSVFLKENSRYSFLFDLPITDYSGWAYGLKTAGYATASNYSSSLINIIEQYNLSRYDKISVSIKYVVIATAIFLFGWMVWRYKSQIKSALS